jgi:hypothetical protein
LAEAAQAGGAVVAPAGVPAAGGLAGDTEPTGDLGLVDALLEQLGCLQAAFLEGVTVPALGDGFAITGCHTAMLPGGRRHVTLNRKTL